MSRAISQWKQSARKAERRMNASIGKGSASRAQMSAVRRWNAVNSGLHWAKVHNTARSLTKSQAEKNLARAEKRVTAWMNLPIPSPENYNSELTRLMEAEGFARAVLNEIIGKTKKRQRTLKKINFEKRKQLNF